jgi:hypothetical protein
VQDADGGNDPEAGASQQAAVPFSQLYDALGKGLTNDRSVLLLYALLYGCQPFQVSTQLARCFPKSLMSVIGTGTTGRACGSF